jgi:Tol biopolymer transport system component
MALMLVGALVAATGTTAVAAPGATTRVSVASDGTEGNGSSGGQPVISGDGRFVVFGSTASNLVAGDVPCAPGPICVDLFAHDRETGDTEKLNIDSDGIARYGWNYEPSVSADGHYVAFVSTAPDLVPGDTNGFADVFVRDRVLGVTERVSVSSEEEETDGGEKPAISADGRFVAFRGSSDDLVPNDTNGLADVFVRDRLMGTTERVNLDDNGTEANGWTGWPSISADGRYVAFYSNASNLVSGDLVDCGFGGIFPSCSDVFVRDRLMGTTELVSKDSTGTPGNHESVTPAISADGEVVTFFSTASNLVADDLNDVRDQFVHNRLTGITGRVSVSNSGAEGNASTCATMGAGAFQCATISASGNSVAFSSFASNLVQGDTNACGGLNDGFCPDIFVRDQQAGTTLRVSVSSTGEQANGMSDNPSISANGRWVVFWSDGSNLVADDQNGVSDVFVHDLGGDEDGDGVDDFSDNCPTVANASGQTEDADGDLAGDACDGPGSGNVDCSGPIFGVNAVDALKVLRHNAALPLSQNEPCLDIGLARALVPPGDWKVGDVNCSGVVNSVDALLILRANAGLSVMKPPGCPEIKPV